MGKQFIGSDFVSEIPNASDACALLIPEGGTADVIKQFRARLDTFLDNGLARHRARLRARRLLRDLSALPVAATEPAWLESEIILRALTQTRAKWAHVLLSTLKGLRDAEGQPQKFAAFCDMVNKTHGIQLPTFHGFNATFADMDVPAILGQMAAMTDVLAGHCLTVFANSGTLLGLVRDGSLLPHDDDIDLAVLLGATTQQEAAAEWTALRLRLGALELLEEDDKRYSPAIIKLRRISGVTVDLFPAWFDAEDRAHVYPHTKGDLPKSAVLPLGSGPLKGINQPHLPKKMLAINYGANWETPDPAFRFDWDAAAAFFKPFLTKLSTEGQ